jgi:hypothetical protein
LPGRRINEAVRDKETRAITAIPDAANDVLASLNPTSHNHVWHLIVDRLVELAHVLNDVEAASCLDNRWI